MQDRLCYIKLINGEDIVAQVEDVGTDAEDFIVFNPLRVHFIRVPGHTGIQLGQWIPFTDENDVYPIAKNHVLWMEECKNDFIQHYNEVIEVYNSDEELREAVHEQNQRAEANLTNQLFDHFRFSANNFTIH